METSDTASSTPLPRNATSFYDLDIRGDEVGKLRSLDNRQYTTPRAIDDEFLDACGITADFYDALRYAGLDEFAEVVEESSAYLTAEFLCTLEVIDNKDIRRVRYNFCLLGRSFSFSFREMTLALKFKPHAR
jgi:hypothetical protein